MEDYESIFYFYLSLSVLPGVCKIYTLLGFIYSYDTYIKINGVIMFDKAHFLKVTSHSKARRNTIINYYN